MMIVLLCLLWIFSPEGVAKHTCNLSTKDVCSQLSNNLPLTAISYAAAIQNIVNILSTTHDVHLHKFDPASAQALADKLKLLSDECMTGKGHAQKMVNKLKAMEAEVRAVDAALQKLGDNLSLSKAREDALMHSNDLLASLVFAGEDIEGKQEKVCKKPRGKTKKQAAKNKRDEENSKDSEQNDQEDEQETSEQENSEESADESEEDSTDDNTDEDDADKESADEKSEDEESEDE